MELTPTEFKVSALVSAGYETKEVAEKLHRSKHTIESHVKNIKAKNKLRNSLEMVRDFVLQFGDPRKYVAAILLSIQVYSITIDKEFDYRRTTKVNKVKRGRKNRE